MPINQKRRWKLFILLQIMLLLSINPQRSFTVVEEMLSSASAPPVFLKYNNLFQEDSTSFSISTPICEQKKNEM